MGTAPTVGEDAEHAVPSDAPAPGPGRAREWLPAGVLVVVAALLSITRIRVRALWLDEAYTVGATSELLDTWRQTGVTQALYYALVWPVARLSTDPAWLRLPSALLGLAAVVVVFRIGRRLGGQRVAVLAAGGLALSWGLARYSVEARSYTLALLLAATSWLALVAIVQSGGDEPGGDHADDGARRRWWRVFYVATALTPLAHGLATLNFVVQLGALAVAPRDRRALLRRAAAVAPVLVLELVTMFSLGAADVGDWVPPLSLGQLRGFKQLLLGFGVTGVVLGVLGAVAIAEVVRRYVRERTLDAWAQVVPAFWALGPTMIILLMSLVRPYAAGRYAFISLPATFLLIAGLLVRHLSSIRRLAPAALLLVPLLLVDHRHVTTANVEDWPELTACIAANVEPGDGLVTAGAHRSAIDYYWPDDPALSSVEPLSPPEPLGEVRRLYESRTSSYDELLSVFLEDTSRSIWFIERLPAGRMGIVGLAFDPDVRASYDLVEPWYFKGNLTLTRLDPLGSERPRGEEPCDTVPTPKDMRPEDTQ